MKDVLKTFIICFCIMIMVTIAFNSTAQELPIPPTKITVSWSIPVERENGDLLLLTEIAGYELFNDCQENPVTIIGGETTSYTLAIALPFSCAFSVLTVDTDGLRSVSSESITVTFNPPKAPLISEITLN